MNQLKFFLFFCLVPLFILLLCGGCTMSADKLYTNDAKIASSRDSYSIHSPVQIATQTEYRGDLEMEGIATLWSCSPEEAQQASVSYFLEVTAGQAKIAFVSADGSITLLAETAAEQGQEQQGTISLPLQKGENRLRLITSPGARLTIQLRTNTGTFQTIQEQ